MKLNNMAITKRPLNGYPWFAPYDPGEAYPEYPFVPPPRIPNAVYDLVRQCLWELDLDSKHRGTPNWNPFTEFIKGGQTVVIKPNFALDYNQEFSGRTALAAVVTDGSVLRPIVDYVFKACGPSGKIVICDTPLQNEVNVELFDNVAAFTGTRAMVNELCRRGVPVALLDLRSQVRRSDRWGFWRTHRLPGDPLGYVEFDLGSSSAFAGLDPVGLQTNDWEDVSKYHRDGHHLYSVSKTILSADVVVNVPKLKAHKKTGLTVAVKNMFALSNRKDCIPHWRKGVDDRPSSNSRLHALLRYCYSVPILHPVARYINWHWMSGTLDGYGNWIGNDTTWRGVLDLNRILLYGDSRGQLHPEKQRNLFVLVDGIIAGEGLGPLGPRPRPYGAVIAGYDPVAVDIFCSQLMGIDPRQVKLLVNAVRAPAPRLTACAPSDLDPVPALDDLREQFELHPDWHAARLPCPTHAHPAASGAASSSESSHRVDHTPAYL